MCPFLDPGNCWAREDVQFREFRGRRVLGREAGQGVVKTESVMSPALPEVFFVETTAAGSMATDCSLTASRSCCRSWNWSRWTK
jgi:hypothetical protein